MAGRAAGRADVRVAKILFLPKNHQNYQLPPYYSLRYFAIQPCRRDFSAEEGATIRLRNNRKTSRPVAGSKFPLVHQLK